MKRLRIAIDAHALGSRLGGNETYLINLLEGLREFPQHDYFAYVTSGKQVGRARELFPELKEVRIIGTTNPLVRLGWRLGQLCALDRVDVLHVQYVQPLNAPAVVATIHDLSFMHHPEWFSPIGRVQLRLTVPWTARNARRVLTISESSRQDIIRTLNLPPSRVMFAHLQLRSIFRPANAPDACGVMERLGISKAYVLAVGNVQPRKNLARLVAAWLHLRRHVPHFDLQLVLVGKPAWQHESVSAPLPAPRIRMTLSLPAT